LCVKRPHAGWWGLSGRPPECGLSAALVPFSRGGKKVIALLVCACSISLNTPA